MKKFVAEFENLPEILFYVREIALEVGFLHPDIHKIELAVEEAAVNCIKHGKLPAGAHLHVHCNKTEILGIEIHILDQGHPFNPVEYTEQHDPQTPLMRRKEGGVGIFLIKKMMDHIHYERKENFNLLILTKYLKPL